MSVQYLSVSKLLLYSYKHEDGSKRRRKYTLKGYNTIMKSYGLPLKEPRYV
jgi:hypothetical protein